jgi:hypothetical protein
VELAPRVLPSVSARDTRAARRGPHLIEQAEATLEEASGVIADGYSGWTRKSGSAPTRSAAPEASFRASWCTDKERCRHMALVERCSARVLGSQGGAA